MPVLTEFAYASLAGWLTATLVAAKVRGRFFGGFASVILGLHTLISLGLERHLAWFGPALYYFQFISYVHFLLLVRPEMRPLWFRALVSIPASFFIAGTFLTWPWALASAVGFTPHFVWLPYVAAALGVVQSLTTPETEIDVVIDRADIGPMRRFPLGATLPGRPLRIIQITDPHLGSFMSVARLKLICRRAVERNPDLILLTGDFLTMESHGSPDALGQALAPLKAFEGRTFACHGNHDHEAPKVVARGLREAGVRLLVDEAVEVETPVGSVQIVGLDFVWRHRRRAMAEVIEKNPRKAGQLRVVLLHDPGAFKHLADGEADLVLSGHTHGGHVGFLSLGLNWTVVSALTKMPDHGLWARGQNRLYVHRATGHYGFPIRVGVPGEQSLMRVHLPNAAEASQATGDVSCR